MREEGSVEGALQAKAKNNNRGKNKKKKQNNNKKVVSVGSNKNTSQSNNPQVFSPCPYCKKTNHLQKRCWWRPDARCHKCEELGHMEKFCKSEQQQGEAKVIEDQL